MYTSIVNFASPKESVLSVLIIVSSFFHLFLLALKSAFVVYELNLFVLNIEKIFYSQRSS